jgi:hypothetical protein
MKALAYAALGLAGTLGCLGCGDSSDKGKGGAGDGGPAGGTGGSESQGSGGATGGKASASGGAAATDECPAMSFSTAPVECLQDWTHAKATYPLGCLVDVNGGVQSTCGAFDTILYFGGNPRMETHCLYDKGTGNLIGYTRTPLATDGAAECASFDPQFTELRNLTCANVSPCTSGDGGP